MGSLRKSYFIKALVTLPLFLWADGEELPLPTQKETVADASSTEPLPLCSGAATGLTEPVTPEEKSSPLMEDNGSQAKEIPVKEESPAKPDKSFFLQVKEEEALAIDEIITTLSKYNVFKLGFKRSHLQALGSKLHKVAPLQFLGYIFTKEELKDCMKTISKSSLKWRGFTDGLKPGLNRAAEDQTLFKDLKGFCDFLNISYEPLLEIAEERDWHEFLSFLMNN
jgi:hypothetical protein